MAKVSNMQSGKGGAMMGKQSAKKALVNKVMDMTESQCKKVMPQMTGMMSGGMMGADTGLTAGQKKLSPTLQKAIASTKKK